jgi:hypothetical protein
LIISDLLFLLSLSLSFSLSFPLPLSLSFSTVLSPLYSREDSNPVLSGIALTWLSGKQLLAHSSRKWWARQAGEWVGWGLQTRVAILEICVV